MSLLSCQELDVSIANVQVTRGFNFELRPGQLWGLMGSNGIGKTTLLKCLAGLNPPDAGEVLLTSRPIQQLTRREIAHLLGMLQQHTVYLFDATVMQMALIGRHPHISRWRSESLEDKEIARNALKAVGLYEFEHRDVTGLSGGEARRLAFASLLVQKPQIFLLDEPTNHLDLQHQLRIMDIVSKSVKTENQAGLCAIHDVNLAARYCSHIVMLFGDGEWSAGSTSEMLSQENLQRLYGCPIQVIETDQGQRFHPLASDC